MRRQIAEEVGEHFLGKWEDTEEKEGSDLPTDFKFQVNHLTEKDTSLSSLPKKAYTGIDSSTYKAVLLPLIEHFGEPQKENKITHHSAPPNARGKPTSWERIMGKVEAKVSEEEKQALLQDICTYIGTVDLDYMLKSPEDYSTSIERQQLTQARIQRYLQERVRKRKEREQAKGRKRVVRSHFCFTFGELLALLSSHVGHKLRTKGNDVVGEWFFTAPGERLYNIPSRHAIASYVGFAYGLVFFGGLFTLFRIGFSLSIRGAPLTFWSPWRSFVGFLLSPPLGWVTSLLLAIFCFCDRETGGFAGNRRGNVQVFLLGILAAAFLTMVITWLWDLFFSFKGLKARSQGLKRWLPDGLSYLTLGYLLVYLKPYLLPWSCEVALKVLALPALISLDGFAFFPFNRTDVGLALCFILAVTVLTIPYDALSWVAVWQQCPWGGVFCHLASHVSVGAFFYFYHKNVAAELVPIPMGLLLLILATLWVWTKIADYLAYFLYHLLEGKDRLIGWVWFSCNLGGFLLSLLSFYALRFSFADALERKGVGGRLYPHFIKLLFSSKVILSSEQVFTITTCLGFFYLFLGGVDILFSLAGRYGKAAVNGKRPFTRFWSGNWKEVGALERKGTAAGANRRRGSRSKVKRSEKGWQPYGWEEVFLLLLVLLLTLALMLAVKRR